MNINTKVDIKSAA